MSLQPQMIDKQVKFNNFKKTFDFVNCGLRRDPCLILVPSKFVKFLVSIISC